MGAGSFSDSFSAFGNLILHTGFPWPALIQDRLLSITCYERSYYYPWEACTFLNKNGGRVDGEQVEVALRDWEKRRE